MGGGGRVAKVTPGRRETGQGQGRHEGRAAPRAHALARITLKHCVRVHGGCAPPGRLQGVGAYTVRMRGRVVGEFEHDAISDAAHLWQATLLTPSPLLSLAALYTAARRRAAAPPRGATRGRGRLISWTRRAYDTFPPPASLSVAPASRARVRASRG
jgi:hypothetical protein